MPETIKANPTVNLKSPSHLEAFALRFQDKTIEEEKQKTSTIKYTLIFQRPKKAAMEERVFVFLSAKALH